MGGGTAGLAPLNLLVFVLVFGLLLLFPWSERRGKPAAREPTVAKRPRPLKPKTGADCPFCQAQPATDVNEGHAAVLPRPWGEVRSPRGRQKASQTRGYACDNPACVYFRITDPAIHALVADGHHGKLERIQDLKC